MAWLYGGLYGVFELVEVALVVLVIVFMLVLCPYVACLWDVLVWAAYGARRVLGMVVRVSTPNTLINLSLSPVLRRNACSMSLNERRFGSGVVRSSPDAKCSINVIQGVSSLFHTSKNLESDLEVFL